MDKVSSATCTACTPLFSVSEKSFTPEKHDRLASTSSHCATLLVTMYYIGATQYRRKVVSIIYYQPPYCSYEQFRLRFIFPSATNPGLELRSYLTEILDRIIMLRHLNNNSNGNIIIILLNSVVLRWPSSGLCSAV